MAERDDKQNRRVDEAGQESFPASDPPSFTPEESVGGQEREPDAERQAQRTKAAERVERARDPHGAAPAKPADEGEPTGRPTADRQRTETTIERVNKPDR